MNNSKLVALLKTFNSDEWNRFNDFIHSPYFNKDARLVKLSSFFATNMAKIQQSHNLKKEELFKAVFPNQVYDKAHFNHLLNYLLRLVEQFLVHQATKLDTLQQDQALLKIYHERRLGKHYGFKRKQLAKTLEQYPYHEENFYYQHFELAKVENDRFLVKRQRVAHSALQDSSLALDTFYIIQQLKFLAEILDRQKKFPQAYNIQDEFKFLEGLIDRKTVQKEPYILVYQHLVVMLLHEEEEDHYNRFKALLDQYTLQIDPTDLKKLFLFAINYCVRKIGAGRKFQQKLLNLYTSGLENSTLLDHGLLSPWTYKNVIYLGLGLGKNSWVEQFIEEYATKLPPRLYEDAYHYNLAALHYARKDYEAAMLELNRVQYSDISYKLWSKELLVKLYFELGELEPLHSLLLSFEQLIKRNKQIPKPQKEAYRNFVKLVSKLIRRPTSSALQEEIRSKKYLRERNWLLSHT